MNFPPGNPLHSICNRSTIKVSYSCLPNMGSIIARHNSKLLRSANPQPKPKASCNCQDKLECPIPGQCTQNGAIYQATVASTGGRTESYVGLAKTSRNNGPNTRRVCWMSLPQGGQPSLNIFGKKAMQAGSLLFLGSIWNEIFLFSTQLLTSIVYA